MDYAALAAVITPELEAGRSLSTSDLCRLANDVFGGTQAQGRYRAKDAFEAAELAVNQVISKRACSWSVKADLDEALLRCQQIAQFTELLACQTARDNDSEALQQFSSPAAYGYALAWIAGVEPQDVVFEPSAGTASLAVHALNAGAQVHVNEISPRRLAILRSLGFSPSQENAEQVHNIFAGKLSPSIILMNPPFSRSVRTGERIDPTVGGAHVSAALQLLSDGGRLVAIVGKSTGAGARRGSWLTGLRARYALRANVVVAGSVFTRQGTTVETRVLVFDKVSPGSAAPITGKVASLGELLRVMAPVRRQSGSAPGGDSRFAPYRPSKLTWPGAHPHPANLVESHAMAAVSSPDIWYRPHFPDEVITEGRISLAQLEAVIYAGQAHAQWLTAPAGGQAARRGFFIGDGTGVGKGAQAAAIIWDNFAQGATRAVWVTKDDTKLLKAARRDFARLGGDPRAVFSLRTTTLGASVSNQAGVMLVSFGALRSARPGRSRLQQIIDWCGGPDSEVVIILDEAHKMGNALDKKGPVGTRSASQTATAGVDLQSKLPRAKVVYVSATGASEVANLAYADRLGIYGPGTPFADKNALVSKIEEGGIAAMEIVARDLKAMGLFCARSLSYADVKYEKLVHRLTAEQRRIYNRLCDAWRLVLDGVNDAMEDACSRKNPAAAMSAYSRFWSAHQSFFQAVLLSMQTGSVIKAIERDLANGYSAVIQIVNTMEAQQERVLAGEDALANLEEVDFTPREHLLQYLERLFPIHAYEEYEDEDGNLRTRPVVDSEGRPVVCQEAVRRRDDLILEIGSLRVPHAALEQLLDHFGVDQVAEATGRKRRVVYLPDTETGRLTRQVQARSEADVLADMAAFAGGTKRIFIFSGAANTGIDAHASLDIANQQLRRHYLLQAGWSAKEAEQGKGRSHRSNQRQAPEYILVTTDIKGQLRFISSIAGRLGRLGALTKGQRDTGSQGLFSERDSLEDGYGEAAVSQLILELYAGRTIAGSFDMTKFQSAFALALVNEEGALIERNIPTVRQFLNRLLGLHIDDQNAVFDEFQARLDEGIQAAIDAGRYNQGVEAYAAERIEIIEPPQTVYVEPSSGATTQYVHLRAWHRRRPLAFDRVQSHQFLGKHRRLLGWVRQAETGAVFARTTARCRRGEDGALVEQNRLIGPYDETFEDEGVATDDSRFRPIYYDEAAELWRSALADAQSLCPSDLHLIVGVLLPIWDRIEGAGRVYRLQDEHGTHYLGRLIHAGAVRSTLAKLGAGLTSAWSARETVDAVMAGARLELANGWRLFRSRVNGQYRLELSGFAYSERKALEALGIMIENIQYRTRCFVPMGEPTTLERLLTAAPVADLPQVDRAA